MNKHIKDKYDILNVNVDNKGKEIGIVGKLQKEIVNVIEVEEGYKMREEGYKVREEGYKR